MVAGDKSTRPTNKWITAIILLALTISVGLLTASFYLQTEREKRLGWMDRIKSAYKGPNMWLFVMGIGLLILDVILIFVAYVWNPKPSQQVTTAKSLSSQGTTSNPPLEVVGGEEKEPE